MGSTWTSLSRRVRFGALIASFSIVFLVVGRLFGEDIAVQLQKTPTTPDGWTFLGWAIGGPPYMAAALFWSEHRRLTHDQFRNRSLAYAAAIGLTFFILPARVVGVPAQFGTGAIVGNPLSAGLVWGLCATVALAIFGGLVILSLRGAAGPAGATPAQRLMTARFLESACIVALVVTLGLALYGGNGSGIFNNGT